LFEKHYYREPLLLSEYEWRRMIAFYWGFCVMVDDIVGEMVAYLKGRGLYDDTVIAFSTDHGDMMGSHGLWEKGYPMQYEEINRIPLVIKVPGFEDAVVADGLMSVADFLPTLAGLAGCPLDTMGRDIRSFAAGDAGRGYHVAQAFELGGGYNKTGRPGGIPVVLEDLCNANDRAAVSIKTARYKYIFHNRDRDELYDLLADPYENVNLARHCMTRHCEDVSLTRHCIARHCEERSDEAIQHKLSTFDGSGLLRSARNDDGVGSDDADVGLYDADIGPYDDDSGSIAEIYRELQAALLSAIADNPPFHKFIKDAMKCKTSQT